MTIPFRHLTGQSVGWRELGSSPPCSACLELLAWVVPGACWKEWSAWGEKEERRRRREKKKRKKKRRRRT